LRMKVLNSVGSSLSSTYILKLVELSPESIPNYLEGNEIIDLAGANYPEGIKELVDMLGASLETRTAPTAHGAPSHISGIFESARAQTNIFAELKKQITTGRIDQKYLYWDPRASLRWQKISELSTYMTSQMTMNLLAVYANSIIQAIIDDANSSTFSFINFGVGTGVKDFLILEPLLKGSKGPVYYFAVDESLSMIQITIQGMQELMSRFGSRLRVHYVLDDFKNVNNFSKYIADVESEQAKRSRPVRILGFLGGSLGNFEESSIMKIIKGMLSEKDYLILGVEYIADRNKDALIANYSDIRMKDFLYGPISDVEGKPPGWEDNFHYEVLLADKRYSSVDESKTIVGYVSHKGELIELFSSTKYERKPLENFLVSMGFKIMSAHFSNEKPPRYGKYVLQIVKR